MNREEIGEALKGYLSYKYGVAVYESHIPAPSAGIANYNPMPSGSGAPERFFEIVGKQADMGNTSFQDHLDYLDNKRLVTEIEGAFGVLTEEEMSIIKLKWMQDFTLHQIAERKHCSEITIKRHHRMALSKLYNALRFSKLPQIEAHVKYVPASSF
jgi:DNA-binding NarL/FixJ family response regulator